MDIIRVLIVEDSLTIRAMIETLLERDEDIRVVGIARNADEAEALIARTNPDVITLDIAMPGRSGWEILDLVMAQDPRPVIMLSSLLREGDAMSAEALKRGAFACFNKARAVQESSKLIKLIKRAAASREQAQDDSEIVDDAARITRV